MRKEAACSLGVYLVTDRRVAPEMDIIGAVRDALAAGVAAVQLREKDLDSRSLFAFALQMRVLTRGYGARLFINDRVDVAMAVGADGVHLGQKSMSARSARSVAGTGFLIGVSTHGLKEALVAEAAGADFITLGPVFPTLSKLGYGEPIGLEKLKTVCASVDVPVYAIGGIKKEQIQDVMLAGAEGAAVISAIIGQPDVAASAREIVEELNSRRMRRVSVD